MQRQGIPSCLHRAVKYWTVTTAYQRSIRLMIASLATIVLMAGCSHRKATVSDLQYCDDIKGVSYYREHNGDVAWPCLDNQTAEVVAISQEPRNLLRRTEDAPREITLAEAIQTALTQNQVIETSALGGVGAKGVLTNPNIAATVYDPAIQASGVLFGRRSVESALADFDATFSSRLAFSSNDVNLPTASITGGGNRAAFTSSLAKQFATGGTISLNHDWYHTEDAIPFGAATPNYAGRIGAQLRQPMLAGSGTEYTRIAGPANPNFGQITGVSQGVAIARINQDISIADFEISVRNAVRDIENGYWDLFLSYRLFDTAVQAHKAALENWRVENVRLRVGDSNSGDVALAADRLYETKAQVELSLNRIFTSESELRRLIGMPMNDGTVLMPVDEPSLAELVPDWTASLTEALTYRTELRRQKWNVKSLQLQLQAARSLVRPRLDLFAGYDVNGAGDTLLSQSGAPFSSGVGSMSQQNLDSWNAGVEFSVPLGYRFSRSQVRNLELQVTRATAILASQEKNIAHDLATSIQNVTSAYSAAQSHRNRINAARGNLEVREARWTEGGANTNSTVLLDLKIRAQQGLANAVAAYYQQVVAYNNALTDLSLSKGTLLEENSVFLAEGRWTPEAYGDAKLRAHARTHAKPAPHLKTEPAEFVSPGPAGSVDLRYISQPRIVEPDVSLDPELRTKPESIDAPAGAPPQKDEKPVPVPNGDPSALFNMPNTLPLGNLSGLEPSAMDAPDDAPAAPSYRSELTPGQSLERAMTPPTKRRPSLFGLAGEEETGSRSAAAKDFSQSRE